MYRSVEIHIYRSMCQKCVWFFKLNTLQVRVSLIDKKMADLIGIVCVNPGGGTQWRWAGARQPPGSQEPASGYI